MKTRTAAILSGLAFLFVAAVTMPTLPLVAVASALGGAACGLLMKRLLGAEASDGTDLCHVIVLSGCGTILGVEFFSAQPVAELSRAHFAPTIESLFFNFGGFILAYVVMCFVIFVVILGSQT